jgi:hypothetical protein
MTSKEEVAAVAQLLAQQLMELATTEESLDQFNRLMLSAQDTLIMHDRLTADPNRGPDDVPDILAPLFEIRYIGPEVASAQVEPVIIMEDGVPVGTFDPSTDTLPEPIPLPEPDPSQAVDLGELFDDSSAVNAEEPPVV